MAAFIKATNAKIRSNPMLSYFCSTRTCSLSLGVGVGRRTLVMRFPVQKGECELHLGLGRLRLASSFSATEAPCTESCDTAT